MAGLPKHLRVLEDGLAALSDETMTLAEFDGYVAGLLVCPHIILPSEWLPAVFGDKDDGGPVFSDIAQIEALTRQIMVHYNSVADTLRRRPERYAPLFDVFVATDETLWEFWIEGFEAAMSLRPASWLPLIEEGGDAARALAFLIKLAQVGRRDPEVDLDKARIDELTRIAPDLIPEFVGDLARRQFGLSASAGRPRKVGRNDPCPCGSEKSTRSAVVRAEPALGLCPVPRHLARHSSAFVSRPPITPDEVRKALPELPKPRQTQATPPPPRQPSCPRPGRSPAKPAPKSRLFHPRRRTTLPRRAPSPQLATWIS